MSTPHTNDIQRSNRLLVSKHSLVSQNKEETFKHGCVKVQLAMKELGDLPKASPHKMQLLQECTCLMHQQCKNDNPGCVSQQSPSPKGEWSHDHLTKGNMLCPSLCIFGSHLILAGSHPASKSSKKTSEKSGGTTWNRAWEQGGLGGNTA